MNQTANTWGPPMPSLPMPGLPTGLRVLDFARISQAPRDRGGFATAATALAEPRS